MTVRRLFTLAPAALRAFARAWFLAGFRCSGYRVHGETRLRDSVAFRRLLDAEFDRAWAEHADRRIDGDIQKRDIPEST